MLFQRRVKPVFYKLRHFLVASALLLASESSVAGDGKVLYVTHEPGKWHDYSSQLQSFREVADEAGWELTVATGDKKSLSGFLHGEDYAAGQDVVVYNFCLADSRDMDAMQNLMAQTVVGGVPAMLVHCAMHSWWDSFKKGKPIPGNTLGKARADKKLLKHWRKQHPDRPLPAWGDFTGVASTGHGRQEPISLAATGDHPVTRKIPAAYATPATELYNNHYLTPDVEPLLMGRQGGDEAIVMWLAPRGESQLIGLTLGHGAREWQDPVFRQLLVDSVEFLMASP